MDATLLKRAIAELDINTPVRRVDVSAEGTLTLHLPHRVLHWRPTPTIAVAKPTTPTLQVITPTDDLTALPYVHTEIALAMNDAGLYSFADIIKVTDIDLMQIPGIGAFTCRQIRHYLKEHYL